MSLLISSSTKHAARVSFGLLRRQRQLQLRPPSSLPLQCRGFLSGRLRQPPAHVAPAFVSYLAGGSSCLAVLGTWSTPTTCHCQLGAHAIVSYPTRERIRPPVSSWKDLRRNVRRAWRLLFRFIKLSLALAPVALFYPFLLITSNNNNNNGANGADAHEIALAQRDDEPVTGFLGWYLRMCLHCVEWSGAAVIKLMQWAGSRPDLFGHDFCIIFSQLQENTTPHRWSHTQKVMREAFGDDWQDKITLNEIVGSGCIGQVYSGEAWIDQIGKKQKVAVKILHPSVEEDIDADLDLMRLAVRAVKWLPFDLFANLKWLNMEGVVEEFAGLLKLQLDLRTEAYNLQKFNKNFEDQDDIMFPEIIPEYKPTKECLVETYCEGVPILQYAREHSDERERLHKLCMTAIEAVCKMIFLDNFMHGDLHPGNVYVSPDGKKFMLFDVGIVAEYSEDDHKAIVDILSAFIRKLGRKAGRLMIDDSNNRLLASKSGDKAVDEELYIDKIEALTIAASSGDYLMEHLGTYISYICEAAAQHHIMLNPCFVSAALAVKVEEGIAIALDPAIEIWRVATPIIVESERRRHVASARKGVDKLLTGIVGKHD